MIVVTQFFVYSNENWKNKMSFKLDMGIVNGKKTYMVCDGRPPVKLVRILQQAWADRLSEKLTWQHQMAAKLDIPEHLTNALN